MNTITGDQLKYITDQITDLRRVFAALHPDRESRDFVNWFGGLVKRHQHEEVRFESLEQVTDYVRALTSTQAKRLIPALSQAFERLEKDTLAVLPREALKTPSYLMRSIWANAKQQCMDKETVAEIIFAITDQKTSSSKNLTKSEAVAVVQRIQGSAAKVIKMSKRSDGKTYLRN